MYFYCIVTAPLKIISCSSQIVNSITGYVMCSLSGIFFHRSSAHEGTYNCGCQNYNLLKIRLVQCSTEQHECLHRKHSLCLLHLQRAYSDTCLVTLSYHFWTSAVRIIFSVLFTHLLLQVFVIKYGSK